VEDYAELLPTYAEDDDDYYDDSDEEEDRPSRGRWFGSGHPASGPLPALMLKQRSVSTCVK
jgi:hypothetical protein